MWTRGSDFRSNHFAAESRAGLWLRVREVSSGPEQSQYKCSKYLQNLDYLHVRYLLSSASYLLFYLLFLHKVDALEATFIRKQLSTPLFSLHFLFHYLGAAKMKYKCNVFSATLCNMAK